MLKIRVEHRETVQFRQSQWWIQDFPDMGEGQPLSLEQKLIILKDVCGKPHENERKWT